MAETKQEVKRTALPWHQGGTSTEELMSPNTIFGADGAAIAQFYGISLHRTLEEINKEQCVEGLGNVATVLRAVNNFEGMLGALEGLLNSIPRSGCLCSMRAGETCSVCMRSQEQRQAERVAEQAICAAKRGR